MNKKKVVVLGAGPIGLITSWLLSEKSWEVDLFEAKNLVGGLCRTWKWNSFYLDTGPHIFHTPDKNLWKFWKNIFKDNLIRGEFWSKNTMGKNNDNYFDYPISLEAIKKLPLNVKNIVFAELKQNKVSNLISNNFKDQVKAQVGDTLQNLFFEGYPEKVWGIKTSEMTAEWAPKRIKLTKKSEPFFLDEFTGVGKYGTGQLYEIIKNKIKGKIHLNHRITKISYNKDQNIIKKIYFNNKNFLKVESDTIIISSLPITLTARLLGYKSKLKFRGIRSVYVSLNIPRCFQKKINWLYYSDKEIIFNRVSEPKTMSKYLSPKNKTFLCAEITYEKDDIIDKMSFEKISKRVLDDLIKVNLIKKETVIDVTENKEDFVYPVQFIDYKDELAKTKYFVSKFNQIYSLGTGGDFDYADSQILFNKSIDLVNILDNKFSKVNLETRQFINYQLNSNVKLGSQFVGDNYPCFVIAEAGLNHNADINLAKLLIDQAISCKCNAIKFQTYLDNSRISSKVKSVNYVEKADGLRESTNEIFNRLSLNKIFHKKIFDYARKKKIEIFSTPFDEKSVDYLEELNVNFYKIASVDIVNLPLIRKVGLTGKPLILSTGMSDFSTVEDAVKVFKETKNKNLILLHCLSSYPANKLEMNLRVIKTFKDLYKIPVGLSDHFSGVEISLMAIGMGANIIEKHFTLDKKYEGPDHVLSLEPKEMELLTNFSRSSNQIIGDGNKVIQPSEYEMINSQRKTIYAKVNILKGQKLSNKNICIKGPAGGIMPKFTDIILGKRIKKSVDKDMPITWEHI